MAGSRQPRRPAARELPRSTPRQVFQLETEWKTRLGIGRAHWNLQAMLVAFDASEEGPPLRGTEGEVAGLGVLGVAHGDRLGRWHRAARASPPARRPGAGQSAVVCGDRRTGRQRPAGTAGGGRRTLMASSGDKLRPALILSPVCIVSLTGWTPYARSSVHQTGDKTAWPRVLSPLCITAARAAPRHEPATATTGHRHPGRTGTARPATVNDYAKTP
jgi:hypothetical protein